MGIKQELGVCVVLLLLQSTGWKAYIHLVILWIRLLYYVLGFPSCLYLMQQSQQACYATSYNSKNVLRNLQLMTELYPHTWHNLLRLKGESKGADIFNYQTLLSLTAQGIQLR